MSHKIIWTEKAWEDLESVVEFISTKSPSAADMLIESVLTKSRVLEQYPEIGPVEPLLLTEPHIYHYLVVGHFKLIYPFDQFCIWILRVFDTRQNPEKLKVQ